MNKSQLTSMNADATLGRDVQQKIGDQLRAYYDDVVSQGVPDRFAELLRRLDDKTSKQRDDDGGGERS